MEKELKEAFELINKRLNQFSTIFAVLIFLTSLILSTLWR